MAKRKKPMKPSKDISESALMAAQVAHLKRELKQIEALPENFRDIEPGSYMWQKFAELVDPALKVQMDEWLHGPVMYFELMSEKEHHVLGGACRTFYKAPHEWKQLTFNDFWECIQDAEELGCSFMYLPDMHADEIAGLNRILSRFNYNLRCKGVLTNENGKRLR